MVTRTMGIGLCVTTGMSCTTTQQGRRSPCRSETGEYPWSAEQSGPWGSTSAPRLGCRRPSTRDRPQKNELRLGSLDDPLNSLDHRKRPLHHVRDDDDLGNLHDRDVDHHVHRQLGNFYCRQDHKTPLRHDRDFDDLHDLHSRGIDHLVQEQLWELKVRRAVWTMGKGICATTGMMKNTTGTSTTLCVATGESRRGD